MSSSISENNKRIAKNTILLYIRQIYSILISLYTSRVVLDVLGVEDFGIYGLVGGIVIALSFLNSAMVGATSRFLTFELGQHNIDRLKSVFSTALFIHVLLSVLFFIIAETIGVWFLLEQLNIPIGRIEAASWVYQFSIISMVLSIVQAPFGAVITAHEHMNMFAYTDMLQSTLRLLIVFLLPWSPFADNDRLIFYGFMMMIVSIVILVIYMVYSNRNFEESRFSIKSDKQLLKPMLLFSGWDLYGSICLLFSRQGVVFIVNIFYGVVLNAAMAIAGQVTNAVLSVASNLSLVVRPQIIKYYAEGNYKAMRDLIYNSSKATTLILIAVITPVAIELNFILGLWLKEIPPFTYTLCFISLLGNIPSAMFSILNTGIHATGNNFKLNIVTGSVFLMNFPLTYLAFSIGLPYWTVMMISVVLIEISILATVWICHKQIPEFKFWHFLLRVILPIHLLTLFTFGVAFVVTLYFTSTWYRLLEVAGISFTFLGILSYFVLLSSRQRGSLRKSVCLYKNNE